MKKKVKRKGSKDFLTREALVHVLPTHFLTLLRVRLLVLAVLLRFHVGQCTAHYPAHDEACQKCIQGNDDGVATTNHGTKIAKNCENGT